MAELEFEDLTFEERDGKIRVHLMNLFYTDIDKGMIKKISPYSIERKKIIFS